LDVKGGLRIERTGTPIFISRAVEGGKTVPLAQPFRVPKVPTIPERYAKEHLERINEFPEKIDGVLVDPLENQSQDDGWRHELDHDVESVFWLLLYWAMVMQPAKGPPGEDIDSGSWSSLLGNAKARERLVLVLSSGDQPDDLIHSVYEPLWPLISKLAATILVDRHWLPTRDVRKSPVYLCEAFQRLILQFIDSNRNEDFMTCLVGDSLRQTAQVAQSQALSSTTTQRNDALERGNVIKRRRLDGEEDKDDNESGIEPDAGLMTQ